MYYSLGKKKRHTAVTNQLVVNNPGFIIHKANHRKRPKLDYDVYKENHPVTPKEVVVNIFDLGYMGVEKDFPEQKSILLYKKKRDQELSQEEKEYNKSHSKKNRGDRACHLQIEKIQDNE
ncbi:MAG: hypothetical protein ABJB76_11110 [Candidatus Nitrosocosmicus sp.]